MRKRTKPEHADIAVARSLAPVRTNRLVRALGWLSEVADQPPLITICASTLAVGLVLRDGALARAGGRMLAAELLATRIKSFIKHRIDRTRPNVLANGGAYRARPGGSHESSMNSFPSGHTAGAAAVARAFARSYPEHARTAYCTAAAIGVIQMPRGKHYATDVTAGLLVGVVAEFGIFAAESLILGVAKERTRAGVADASVDAALPHSAAQGAVEGGIAIATSLTGRRVQTAWRSR